MLRPSEILLPMSPAYYTNSVANSPLSTTSSRLSLFSFRMSEGTEVWRECIRWMGDAGVLDQQFIMTVTMRDFGTLLRDGVILCRLSQVLCPGAEGLRNLYTKPGSQFMCLQNITCFLNICAKEFGLSKEDLFEPIELFNLQNFVKVLNVLSLISYSEKALRLNLAPFPRRGDSPGAQTPTRTGSFTENSEPSYSCFARSRKWKPTEKEEEIYQGLQDMADDIDEKIYDTLHYQNQKEEPEEKVYDVLVKRAKCEQERNDPATTKWLEFNPLLKRDHVIKEILDTEQNYVEKGLQMISKNFHSPLEKVLKPEDTSVIFMNISALWQFHSSFYLQLRDAVFTALRIMEKNENEERPSLSIGDVFILNKHNFTLYGNYCLAMDESRQRIEKLEKSDSEARKRMQECCHAHGQQFKLQDLLCLPMQRVLKYHLLLRELLSQTTLDHPDFRSLKEAKEAMEDVNTYVNELKRDMESRQAVDAIQTSILDLQMPNEWTLHDYGRAHKDGEVKMAEHTSHSFNGKFKTRYCFLFDKVLLVCKANRNNTFTYKNAFVVHELRPELRNGGIGGTDNGTLNGIGGTISRKLGGVYYLTFIRHLCASSERECQHSVDYVRFLQFSFKSETARHQWLQAFEMAIRNVSPEVGDSGHNVHFTSFTEKPFDDWPPCCSVCQLYLKGMFYQGYKCERCKRLFHRDCIRLDRCAGGTSSRRTSTLSTSASFNTTSAVNFSNQRARIAVQRGEQVATKQRFTPSDSNLLSFDKDDILEVLQVIGNGMIKACHVTNRTRLGMVSIDHIRRVRGPSALSLDSPVGRGSFIGTGGVIHRKESTILPRTVPPSIDPPKPPSLPKRVSPTMDYVNTEIDGQEWYMGELSRDEAENRLKGCPNGTFLVRFSPKKHQYAVSISFNGEVKHTVVEEPGDGVCYLDENNKFPSVVELINYYREHNMRESFTALDTKLTRPYRECKVFKAVHPYAASEQKFLELRVGDIVSLIDTMGEERGWWKGRIGDRIGFFPLNYVEPITDIKHSENIP